MLRTGWQVRNGRGLRASRADNAGQREVGSHHPDGPGASAGRPSAARRAAGGTAALRTEGRFQSVTRGAAAPCRAGAREQGQSQRVRTGRWHGRRGVVQGCTAGRKASGCVPPMCPGRQWGPECGSSGRARAPGPCSRSWGLPAVGTCRRPEAGPAPWPGPDRTWHTHGVSQAQTRPGKPVWPGAPGDRAAQPRRSRPPQQGGGSGHSPVRWSRPATSPGRRPCGCRSSPRRLPAARAPACPGPRSCTWPRPCR